MNKLEKLDQSTVSPHLSPPVLADGEKLKIHVVHDESTLYSNADQTRFWSNGHVPALHQKSLGSSIMVSDFIVEGYER